MKALPFLPAAVLIATAALGMHELTAGEAQPNFILINIDDMRYDFFGGAGHPYLETPTIDRIAREGVNFTRFYSAAPLCGPSRASLLTGQMPSRTTIYNHENINKKDYPASPLLPGNLQELGYRTGFIGKLHMGSNRPRKEFDDWFAINGVPQDRTATLKEQRATYQEKIHFDMLYNRNGEVVRIQDYSTDVCFREAEAMVDRLQGKPFFLYLAPFAAHAPLKPAPRHADRYAGKGIPLRSTLNLDKLPPALQQTLIKGSEDQAEMMLSVDEGLARLIAHLEKNGLLHNTILIFMGDNGTMYGEHGFAFKQHFWEESARTPLVIWGPSRWVKGGRKSPALISHTDILPTCIDLAGGKVPEGLYGVSQKAVLDDEKAAGRENLLVEIYPLKITTDPPVPRWAAVVTPEWKLAVFSDGTEPQLTNPVGDPFEEKNFALNPSEAGVLAELGKLLETQLQTTGAPSEWVQAGLSNRGQAPVFPPPGSGNDRE